VPTTKQQYLSELNAIAERYGKMEDATIKRILVLLRDLRAQIAAEVTSVTDWDTFRRGQQELNIQRLIDEFQAQLRTELDAGITQAVVDGGESVYDPFRKVGITQAFFTPSTAQLNTFLDYSAKLVQKIGDDVRGQIDTQVRLAALGGKTPFRAMQDVTKALGIQARTGVWKKRHDPVKGVAARSETIVRTEMQRAFNLSTYSQQQDAADLIPGLLKSWMATGDTRTRRGHLRAHMEYKNNPIPVKAKFKVYDMDKKGRVKGHAFLLYPGDPNAPPQYTIQCRCRTVTHHPAIGRVGSSLDGRIAQMIKRAA
jgi:hypothetical protein